ncbi:MAG TPA: GspH/FimT family pseudopilin [Steroidobacteraceae bacterium]
MPPMKYLSHGFTLIELLVTMTVAAILVGLAVPAFTSFLQNDRDTGQINSLVASLNYARSEAVKRASPNGIIVCPSTDGVNCVVTASWINGWIVKYVDPLVPANDVVLQNVPALSGTNTVNTDVGPAGAITFSSSGGASADMTIRVCDTRGGAFARQVEILKTTGRIAASQKPGQSVAGAALACP